MIRVRLGDRHTENYAVMPNMVYLSVETTERYLGRKQLLRGAPSDKIGLEA